MIRFYAYKGCDSCRRARKWLQTEGISFKEIAIRDQPPTLAELQHALKIKGRLKALFNTSGMDYRKMGMKDKLPSLDDSDALLLLSQNGNLIKRPFVTDGKICLIGFKLEEWQEQLNPS